MKRIIPIAAAGALSLLLSACITGPSGDCRTVYDGSRYQTASYHKAIATNGPDCAVKVGLSSPSAARQSALSMCQSRGGSCSIVAVDDDYMGGSRGFTQGLMSGMGLLQ